MSEADGVRLVAGLKTLVVASPEHPLDREPVFDLRRPPSVTSVDFTAGTAVAESDQAFAAAGPTETPPSG